MIDDNLFLEDYLFRGKHAKMAKQLTSEIDKRSSTKIFNSAIELYISSAVMGCLINKQVNPDNGSDQLRIFTEQFVNHGNTVRFIYKLVLIAGKYTDNKIKKINKAFRNLESKNNHVLFEKYMLGGLEEIYMTFFGSKNKVRYEEYLGALKGFLSTYNNLGLEDDGSSGEENDLYSDSLL